MGKLIYDKIKEEMKKGEVILRNPEEPTDYKVLGFTYSGHIVLEDDVSNFLTVHLESEIPTWKIKGLEPKIVTFYRHYYSKPLEVGWHFYTSDITGMQWKDWVHNYVEDEEKEHWKLLETEIVKEIEE